MFLDRYEAHISRAILMPPETVPARILVPYADPSLFSATIIAFEFRKYLSIFRGKKLQIADSVE